MICLFGMAGSGKSTQGRNLAEKFGWRWLSVGQVLRDTGRFDAEIKKGLIVDEEETIKIVNAAIEKAEAEGFYIIFDQYPRSERQIEWMANELVDKIEGIMILDVPKEELLKRLAERERADDLDIETIKRRFGVFEEFVGKSLPIFESKGVPIVHIDGTGSIEEVSERLSAELKELVPDAMEQINDVNGGDIERSYGE